MFTMPREMPSWSTTSVVLLFSTKEDADVHFALFIAVLAFSVPLFT